MKLYKTDSKGKTRVWYAQTIKDNLIVTHGLLDGKLITETTKCLPKNTGRANATTAEQQAALELAALYKKKVDRDGYTVEQNGSVGFIQPMLARDYSKVGHQVDWNKKTYGSTKLDGVRAIWVRGKGFQSRKGTFYRVAHLEYALAKVDALLDGELYVHGEPLNRIVAAVKKPNALTPNIEFRVFDCITDGNFDTRFDKAYEIISKLHPKIKIVPHVVIKNEGVMKQRHNEFVQQGYEGIMIRQNGEYRQGVRSDSLYKYKEFEEDEFTIIGVKGDKRNQAIFECDGFDVRMRGSDESREYALQHPKEFIGKQITVRYFTLTEFGKPQFPVGVTVRDDL